MKLKRKKAVSNMKKILKLQKKYSKFLFENYKIEDKV